METNLRGGPSRGHAIVFELHVRKYKQTLTLTSHSPPGARLNTQYTTRTHEVEVPLSAEPVRDQPYHLVQRDAAIDDQRGVGIDRHVRVHILVDEPEDDGLVADQRLVVTLAVRDVFLAVAPVHQRVTDVGDAPVLVLSLLHELAVHKASYYCIEQSSP